MYKITGEVELTRLVDCLDKALIESVPACMQLLKKTSQDIVNDAQRNITQNGNIKTGKLKNSLKYKISNDGTRSVIKASASHGIFIENGTKAHIIRAKKAKALRFEVGGQVIFAKEVRHPGTKANPFLKPAFDEHSIKFIKGLEDIANGNY